MSSFILVIFVKFTGGLKAFRFQTCKSLWWAQLDVYDP